MALAQHSAWSWKTPARCSPMPTASRPPAPRSIGTVGYCMSGRYAINAATHFPIASRPRPRSTARIWRPTSPTARISPQRKTKAELYFACAETDIYAPLEIIEKVKQAMQRRQRRGRDLSRHPSRLRLSEASGLRPRRRRAALGAAAGALSPQPLVIRRDAASHHRLSRLRSDRHRDRADRDPLVCAGLYRRHRAGLDLCARADQEREAVGRAGADLAAADGRFHPVGHDRHHPRRPHRLCAVLQSAVLHRSIPPRSSSCGRAACRSTAASSAASPR